MLEFVKFHGLGNDFIIVEGDTSDLGVDEIRRVCRRHRGVGADGVLFVQPTDAGVAMVVYNRDGTRPEMCGNGVRCVAAYAVKYMGLDTQMVVDSDAGPRACQVERRERHRWDVTVDMGTAQVGGEPGALRIDDRQFEYVDVDMGNPHAVIFEMPEMELIDRLGAQANSPDSPFEEGVNLEFVHQKDDRLEVVVYERGVGRTRACGTGACAVAAAAWDSGRCPGDESVDVELPGGVLTIANRTGQVWMTGPAQEVFRGQWSSEG